MTAFQRQQEDMKKLRQDITKSQQSNSIIQSMKSRIEKLEKNISTKVDSLVNEHTKAERILLASCPVGGQWRVGMRG